MTAPTSDPAFTQVSACLDQNLITIDDWKNAQRQGKGADRLITLVELENRSNVATKAWVNLASPDHIRAQWDALKRLPKWSELPLLGVPFAVKDNIDVEGFPTTAACPAFRNVPAATDAPVVARLRAAGAIVIGKTNMDQFATGLVGTRSPHGATANSFDADFISGGSSSGSGVVVARGIVPFSLGTDTAGSGRVPAGLNNIVGLKPTRGALSARGVVPACRTLDCVSIFALTVQDAQTVLSIAEGYDEEDPYSRPRPIRHQPLQGLAFTRDIKTSPPRIAICSNPPWYGRDDHYPAYEAALEKASRLGWELVSIDFSDLFTLAKLLYEGPWVAERYAAIKTFLQSAGPDSMDPTVRQIVLKAENFSAVDAFSYEYQRQDLSRKIEMVFQDFDAILVPTTPTFPTIAKVQDDPVGENSLLGTYTNFVNFLDWSALSVPAGFRPDGLPFGVTLIAGRWQESRLFEISQKWLSNSPRRLGATQVYRPADGNVVGEEERHGNWTSIAVVGAHLSGYPLNKDLTSRGGRLQSCTKTSSLYKLYALNGSSATKKPGLKRVHPSDGGRQIEVEVWELPAGNVAGFMDTIPSPLGIGSIELETSQWVRGFICEPVGLEDAKDITEYGGWRAYREQLQRATQLNGHGKQLISRVLIANRGEIAVRIIKTLKKLHISAISIYSDADATAPHVRDADISLRLLGDSVLDTYLDGPQILNLAKANGADAIIPGYGFLSENAEFANAVEAASMVWIGPTGQQMSDLGLKHRAREIAIAAKVPVIRGSPDLVTSIEEARIEAERIGFPLMIKSTAGGGGIGLRRCHDFASLEDGFQAVQRLATTNFGDGGIFLEKYIENARHIEVQILGDGKGRVIALGDRDCSLQRRHQKVIEESPAFAVTNLARREMAEAAVRLASSVKYRNVGTVEFIYDVDTQEFFFLEVNTRLQVEHPVTESVTGLDLVECMLRVASGDSEELFSKFEDKVPTSGASVEVRVYAESPLQNFQPCSGTVRALKLPSTVRVDTWIEVGTSISVRYDPLLAKFIAVGDTREEAICKLAAALEQTEIVGVETNLEYLRQIFSWLLFKSGDYTTKSLDLFQFVSPSIQVLEPGGLTTIQDFPGRVGYWNVGIPPSGPMDHVSFRLANRLVNNPQDAAGLECTFQGPKLKFLRDSIVAVTGGDVQVTLDCQPAAFGRALWVKAGQILKIGSIVNGYRAYLAISGGLDVPKVFGSRATFEVGVIGGIDGKKLARGDILPLGPVEISEWAFNATPAAPLMPIPTQPNAEWTIGVVPGPHGAPDYLLPEGLEDLFASEWHVHHNSNRMGIRLSGPKPQWARQDGGEAGLHPSNIHDSPYSIGSISFTGDEAVILTCDGPSLGGFVVFCVVASSELWKVGQLRPGDIVRLSRIDTVVANKMHTATTTAIETLTDIPLIKDFGYQEIGARTNMVVGSIDTSDGRITARQAGNHAMILEFDKNEAFSMRQSFKIHAFCQNYIQGPVQGLKEVTPGVRTVHIIYDEGLTPQDILDRLSEFIKSYAVSYSVPSRTIHLPLAFDDSVSRVAVDRYAGTIRSHAPWLPSNVKFLEELNGLEDISTVLYDSTFLVLGLGDVFLGSPCAIPLDPRHRLFGTKYNPSRSFTPHRSVGIGGQYMCIYATDSPGGYQLVGRTLDIWDASKCIACRDPNTIPGDDDQKPWLFRPFDRIKFFPLDEEELDSRPAAELMRITEGKFDLEEYETWVAENKEDIDRIWDHRQRSILAVPSLETLCEPYRPVSLQNGRGRDSPDSGVHFGGEEVKASMPGKCYKLMVENGRIIQKGDILMWIESSKMEIEIRSPVRGKVTNIWIKDGDLMDVGNRLVTVEPDYGTGAVIQEEL